MQERNWIKRRVWFSALLMGWAMLNTGKAYSQKSVPDSVRFVKQESFYDSLQVKAQKSKFVGWLYDALISPSRPYVDRKTLALDYFDPFEGKVIADIRIQALDAFGPTCSDTCAQPANWAERLANGLHTNTSHKTIQKHLLFKVGDLVDPELMYENERLLREQSYIRDARIFIRQDSIYVGLVHVLVMIKDRFSFGVSGGLNSTQAGDIKVYDRNILGVGHELSVSMLGHVNKEPYLGFETFYKMNNIAGKFLDIKVGYMNSYRREGMLADLQKPFYLPTTRWGYGATSARMFRIDRISESNPVEVKDPLNLSYNSVWAGHGFCLNPKGKQYTQGVVSASISNWNYFEEPSVSAENKYFFANHTLYLLGLSINQRRYIQDQLIYSYGITEDIPEGFKNELVYGWDVNEYGNRQYLHLFSSNGNLLLNRAGYFYSSAGIGGYFAHKRFEEGQVELYLNFISKLNTAGRKRVRTFATLDYRLGIRRYDIENLELGTDDLVRGFHSDIAVGKQRLGFKLEHVIFMPQQFYKFNIALFGFADAGLIGTNRDWIFRQNFYSGLGVGLRLHNENLVFETFRIRLAFYPFHPSDVSFIGFVWDEQSKQRFRSFEPEAPYPLVFE